MKSHIIISHVPRDYRQICKLLLGRVKFPHWVNIVKFDLPTLQCGEDVAPYLLAPQSWLIPQLQKADGLKC